MLFLKQSTHKNDYKSFGEPKCSWILFIISSSWYFFSQYDNAKHLSLPLESDLQA